MIDRLLADALKAHLVSGKPPVLPAGGALLWTIFGELDRTRQHGFGGPLAISHGEIDAWARLHRWPLQAHHIASIRALDDAWLDHTYAKQKQAPEGVKTLPARSSHAMTPAIFDVVMG